MLATAQHMPNVEVNWISSISKCYMPVWLAGWRTRTLHKCSQCICQLSNQLRMSIPWKQSNRPIKLWMIWLPPPLSCRFSEWFFNNLDISFASKLVTAVSLSKWVCSIFALARQWCLFNLNENEKRRARKENSTRFWETGVNANPTMHLLKIEIELEKLKRHRLAVCAITHDECLIHK